MQFCRCQVQLIVYLHLDESVFAAKLDINGNLQAKLIYEHSASDNKERINILVVLRILIATFQV